MAYLLNRPVMAFRLQPKPKAWIVEKMVAGKWIKVDAFHSHDAATAHAEHRRSLGHTVRISKTS